jgi:hypothetical protein
VSSPQTISIVIPVYRGSAHLPGLLQEIEPLTHPHTTAAGYEVRVAEVILVHDCGPDDSDRVLREAGAAHDWIRPVWLSRNFGQHPATIAGMASSSGDWIVTMDEDGQHDPADIGTLLDTAMAEQARLVYAAPVNPAPHSAFRNVTSRASKQIINVLAGGSDAAAFHSFRLVLGEVGRSVAAYAGHGISVLVGRLSNLYGPGQDLHKPQGVISQLCRAQWQRSPMTMYVSLDTNRDYLFVDDAAQMVLAGTRLLSAEPDGTVVVKILASQTPASLALLIGELRRVSRRRAPIIVGTSPSAKFQSRDLRFRSEVWPSLDPLASTPLPAGIHATLEDVSEGLRR